LYRKLYERKLYRKCTENDFTAENSVLEKVRVRVTEKKVRVRVIKR
jgi:hypothetical protein